jgi:hypothetical protein
VELELVSQGVRHQEIYIFIRRYQEIPKNIRKNYGIPGNTRPKT